LSDARPTIKGVVDDMAVTLDDNSTPATILHIFEGADEDLDMEFATLDYDVVVVYGENRTRTQGGIHGDVEYVENYPIKVLTVDKYSGGVLVGSGPTLQYKAKAQVRSLIEGASRTTYMLEITGEEASDSVVGGVRLYQSVYSIEYREA
jgi:hypothetical protein